MDPTDDASGPESPDAGLDTPASLPASTERESPRFTRRDLESARAAAWAEARREFKAQRDAAEAMQLAEELASQPDPEPADPIVERIRAERARKQRVMHELSRTFGERHLGGRRR